MNDIRSSQIQGVFEGDFLGDNKPTESYIFSSEKSNSPCKLKCAQVITEPFSIASNNFAFRSSQIWSWDITYLATSIRGQFFYLYLFIDIFSRKIVGWQIFEEESARQAADLITDICWRENIAKHQVTLHSDNGSPMKGATILATMRDLGIAASRSRPAVSNDNP